MTLEGKILATAVVVSLLSLAFTPKNKRLELQFIILFVQLPTWILGLSAVELGLLEYPARELATVNRTSFIFEYMVLPILCVHVNNYYPWQAARLVKAMYFTGISLLITGIEVFLEQYTLLIKYSGWQWYWTFISITLVFWLNQKMVKWFFKRR